LRAAAARQHDFVVIIAQPNLTAPPLRASSE
jgi:hypothetical protein